ncbi:unnamed protein product [Durusdinium trenchii]|uniref:Uncharacterized protein n=1 Tax=Durusdinium trenchii TaxID=1381693 RepID=A0ABP0SZ22_9DINO
MLSALLVLFWKKRRKLLASVGLSKDEMPELDIQSCPFPLLYRGNELDSEPEIRDGFHNAPWAEWRFNMSGSLRHQQLTLFWSCH